MKRIPQLHVPALLVIAGTALVLAILWYGWTSQVVYAQQNCQAVQPAQGNYVGTGTDHVVAVYAVSVNLNSRQPTLCNGNATWSGSAVWTNIGSTTNCGWAQVGYFKRPNLAIKVYAEYNKKDCYNIKKGDYNLKVWGTGQNGIHTYQVKFKLGKHLARFWYDSFPIIVTPFDPGAEWGPQPWDREWNGETHDPGDDMPGSAANPVNFTNLLYQNCANCPWLDPGIPATTNTLPGRYGLQQDAGSSFHIWTK